MDPELTEFFNLDVLVFRLDVLATPNMLLLHRLWVLARDGRVNLPQLLSQLPRLSVVP